MKNNFRLLPIEQLRMRRISSPRLVVDAVLADLPLFIVAYTEIKNYWAHNL